MVLGDKFTKEDISRLDSLPLVSLNHLDEEMKLSSFQNTTLDVSSIQSCSEVTQLTQQDIDLL